jgi:cytochrome c-type biogenesis protein CcmH/NrfG
LLLAHTLAELGYLAPAVRNYHKALQLKPDSIYILRNLAWLLATAQDNKIYNPDAAVEFAARACRLSDFKDAKAMATLAAAYAAAENFKKAAETAQIAIDLADSLDQKILADEIRTHLLLYKTGRPYRLPQTAQKSGMTDTGVPNVR